MILHSAGKMKIPSIFPASVAISVEFPVRQLIATFPVLKEGALIGVKRGRQTMAVLPLIYLRVGLRCAYPVSDLGRKSSV